MGLLDYNAFSGLIGVNETYNLYNDKNDGGWPGDKKRYY